MAAAAALAAARRRASTLAVGYDYATVVKRGEWWRAAASFVGHGSVSEALRTFLVLACAATSGKGTVPDALWWTAALHGGGVLGGLAWTRRGGRDEVLGARGAAAGWAARRWADGTVAAPVLAVALALLAPTRPRAPLVVAFAMSVASVRFDALADVGASAFWRGAATFWALLVTLASRKATRPRSRVPGVAFSRWPPRRARDADAARPGDVSLDGADVEALRRRRRAPPDLERGRRRARQALGAHGGPVFPWLVVVDGAARR